MEFQSPDLAKQNPWAAAGWELLISHDPSWAAETKEKIETQNNERNSQSLGQVCSRLDAMSTSLFCRLSISDELHLAHSVKYSINMNTRQNNGTRQRTGST